MTDTLQEWDHKRALDHVATNVRNWRDRQQDKALSRLGSHFNSGQKANGRLTTRLIADTLYNGWKHYSGALNAEATPENIYAFLKTRYSHVLDDAALREITGMPPLPPPPPPPPPDKKPTPPQPFTKKTAMLLKALVNHIMRMCQGRATESILHESPQTIPQTLKQILDIGRAGDDETQGAVIDYIDKLKSDKVTGRDPAIRAVPIGPEMFEYDPLAKTAPNRRAPRVRTPPATGTSAGASGQTGSQQGQQQGQQQGSQQGQQQTGSQPQQGSAQQQGAQTADGRPIIRPDQYQELLRRVGGNPSKITPEMIDALPPENQAAAPATNASTTQNQPTQQNQAAAPATNASTRQTTAPDGIPFLITRNMRWQLMKLGYTAADIAGMKPADAWQIIQSDTRKAAAQQQTQPPQVDSQAYLRKRSAVPDEQVVPPVTPAQPLSPTTPRPPTTPESSVVTNLNQQLAPLLSQPDTDPRQVLGLIRDALGETRPDTIDRQQLIALMRQMQQNPQIIAKVPQLGELTLESRSKSGRRLTEEEAYKRSELDRIFRHVAMLILKTQKPQAGSGNNGSGNNGNRGGNDSNDDDDDDDNNSQNDDSGQLDLKSRLDPQKFAWLAARSPINPRDKNYVLVKDALETLAKKGPPTIGDLFKYIVLHNHSFDPNRLGPNLTEILQKSVQ